MLKYVQTAISTLKSRVAGMKANATKWSKLDEVTVAELETDITALETQSGKVDLADTALQNEQSLLRKLTENLMQKVKKVDNFALGLHSEEPIKLNGYGISIRKTGNSKPVPSKVMITSIVDGIDGEGFEITWQKLSDATYYEIEKGVAANTGDMSQLPAFVLYKSTTKITVSDDEVEKGRRCFYRVRGVNPSGTGEWSEPVNKVQ